MFLACSDGAGTGCAEIRYTLDGGAPSEVSLLYGEPLVVADGSWLRFVAFDRAGNRSDVGSATFRVDSVAPTTNATPPPGAFAAAVDLALGCEDGAGTGCAAIRYTLDGTVPSVASPRYEAPLHLAATTAVRYQSVDVVGNEEAPQEARYVVDLLPPTTVPNPPAGVSRIPVAVTLSCHDADTACAETRYTTDGSAPGPGSSLAAAPIVIARTTTLRFASIDAVGNVEPPREARYVVDPDPPGAWATPSGGAYGAGLEVTLRCDDGAGSGCTGLWYTLDGSTPTRASLRYGAPIALAASATLRFVAFDDAGNASPVASETYAVDANPPHLVDATPGQGAGGADPATELLLVFDEPLDAGALSATVNGVPATLAYDESTRTVSVAPAAPLAPDTAYVVTLAGVRDAFGNAAGEVSLSFRTRGAPLQLAGAGSATAEARGLAHDAAGNGVALFSTYTGKGRRLLFARWDPVAGAWKPPAEVARENVATAAGAFAATVASDGAGFLVVWSTAAAVTARAIDAAGTLGAPITLWARGGATALAATQTRGIGWAVVASFGGALEAAMSVGLHFEVPEAIGFASGSVKLISRGNQCLAAYRRVSGGESSIVVALPGWPVGWDEWVIYTSLEPLSDPDIAEQDTAGVGVAFTTRGTAGATFAFVSDAGYFLPIELIADGDDPTSASIGATADGFAVAWQARSGAGDAITRAAFRPPGAGGTWSPQETIWTASGAPATTRLSPSAAGWVAIAATSGDAPATVLAERGRTGWSQPEAIAPAGLPPRGLALSATPGGHAVAFDQDDGERIQVRAVRRVAGALGPVMDLLPPQAGSARDLEVAGDDAGGGLAVWTEEHRGGPAVFAARGRGGAFDPAVLVALGADQPAVAMAGGDFAVVYRRGGTCEGRILGPGGLGAAARLDVGATLACSAPRVVSEGRRFLAVWKRSYGDLGAALHDDGGWSPPVSVASGLSVPFGWDVAGQGGRFAVTFGAEYDPLRARVATGPAVADWGPARDVNVWVQTGGVNRGPALAAGAAGFAVLWTAYNRVWASLSADGETWGTPALLDAPTTYCSAPAMAPIADGFVATWDCGGPRARVWRNGWSGTVALPASSVAAARLAGGAPGAAFLLRESAGAALRGTTWRGGAWAPLETLRPAVSGEPTLAWDGEAWLAGWVETDAAEPAIERVVVRRGL